MKLVARVVAVPANPLGVARSLADEPGFSFLWTSTGDAPSYVACRPIDVSEELDPEPELGLDAGLTSLASVPRWIGVLPYECRRGLERRAWAPQPDSRPEPHRSAPLWQRYGAVVRIGRDVCVVGDDADRVDELGRLLRRRGAAEPVRVTALSAAEPDDLHEARVRRSIEHILDGDVYVVNVARRFDFEVAGRPVDLVAHLAAHARAPYAAALDWEGLSVAGSSPELLLDLDVRRGIVTQPIKGTRPRGADAVEDRRLADELARDPKEVAELTMVVDVERNDVGRVSETGSVRVRGAPVVRSFGAVHHRVATVTGRLRTDVSRRALLESMLPSGSVTGAPKVRAMEIIAALEASRRGIYTGGIGYLSYDGAARFAMAIRMLSVRSGLGHYFAGGGIVADSDPAKEVLETRWKAEQMTRLLRGFRRHS